MGCRDMFHSCPRKSSGDLLTIVSYHYQGHFEKKQTNKQLLLSIAYLKTNFEKLKINVTGQVTTANYPQHLLM